VRDPPVKVIGAMVDFSERRPEIWPNVVGDLTVAYEGLEMAAEPGLTLTIYAAEPGSPSEEALRLLGSWAASQDTESAGAR